MIWHLDVEGLQPRELGKLLDISPNSVSALVYRARAGLREAYLEQHMNLDDPSISSTCRDIRRNLSGVVRQTASVRHQDKVRGHLQACPECHSVYLDLREVNQHVG